MGTKTLDEMTTPTKVFKDFSHASSHLFKARLLADPQWTESLGLCGKTQPRIKQTPLGGIARNPRTLIGLSSDFRLSRDGGR